jgi:hypothetical protein
MNDKPGDALPHQRLDEEYRQLKLEKIWGRTKATP